MGSGQAPLGTIPGLHCPPKVTVTSLIDSPDVEGVLLPRPSSSHNMCVLCTPRAVQVHTAVDRDNSPFGRQAYSVHSGSVF